MQIILNTNEVEVAIRSYIENNFPIESDDLVIQVSEDGTATILIGEEATTDVATPPVEVKRRTRKPREAKHVMVPEPEAKEEVAQVGNQNENTSSSETVEEPEPVNEEDVQEEVKEVAETPAAKPSLFGNLRRS